MSRRPQTCADCARRKIRCNKIIPCDNCTKRGSAHLCKRADVIHSVERYSESHSQLPGLSELPSAVIPGESRATGYDPVNERILSLVTTLSERVKSLESKLEGVEIRKRSAPEERPIEVSNSPGTTPVSIERPAKQVRIDDTEISQDVPTSQNIEVLAENYSNVGQHGSDVEAEDAATVLEFLAWGRLKDSSLTSGIRDVPNTSEAATYLDQDVIQETQAWGMSPNSVPGGQMSIETMQMSQIQDLLPTKEQVFLLFQYHSDWLLFMHCSFHVETFRGELDQLYNEDHGIITMTSAGLQWTALLFAIICGSMTCVKPDEVVGWGFERENHAILAKRWYQASVDCLNAARYQQYHNLYGVQTITTSTICAHILGFSNSQSVLLASAVRVAQSLGLHRLGKSKRMSQEAANETKAEVVQRELGRRLWQQLATQDWFSVPFSETYCVNPLHFSTKAPLQCDEDTMEPILMTRPAITTYGNFLFRVASLMPSLLDQSSEAESVDLKYEQVLRFDRMMREIVISQLPSCLHSQTPADQSWPKWVSVARKTLTITSAHKIIMIHRRFLGLSFHDKRFAFTRKTCLAAAKTIINEMKQEFPDESPILWTTQAFSVAAAIILSLDNFNRHQSAREYEEHRKLIIDTISILSKSLSISSIAVRGTRLLTELLAEEKNHDRDSNTNTNPHTGLDISHNANKAAGNAEKSLNVAAFVKKFCESDQPPPGSSPIATSHMPLWLQQDNSFQPFSDSRREIGPGTYSSRRGTGSFSNFQPRAHQHTPAYDTPDQGFQFSSTHRRHPEMPVHSFPQAFSDSFDVGSVNWFDDLLGLAPFNSI